MGQSKFFPPGFGQKCVSFWARRAHIAGRSFCLRDGYFEEADFEETSYSGEFGLNLFTSRLEEAFTDLVTFLRHKVPGSDLFPVRDPAALITMEKLYGCFRHGMASLRTWLGTYDEENKNSQKGRSGQSSYQDVFDELCQPDDRSFDILTGIDDNFDAVNIVSGRAKSGTVVIGSQSGSIPHI